MYFHCQTTLIDSFKEMHHDQLEFGGNRCIIFHVKDKVPVAALSHCVAMALTYHLNKRNHRVCESKHKTRRSIGRAKATRP